MRFALTSLDLETVTPHAGRCRSFLVYEAEADIEPVKVKDLYLAEDQIFHVFESDGPHPLDEVKVVITGNAREKVTAQVPPERSGYTESADQSLRVLGQSVNDVPA